MSRTGILESDWHLLERLAAGSIALKSMLRVKGKAQMAFWRLVERGDITIEGDDIVVSEGGRRVLQGAWVIDAQGARVWRQLCVCGD